MAKENFWPCVHTKKKHCEQDILYDLAHRTETAFLSINQPCEPYPLGRKILTLLSLKTATVCPLVFVFSSASRRKMFDIFFSSPVSKPVNLSRGGGKGKFLTLRSPQEKNPVNRTFCTILRNRTKFFETAFLAKINNPVNPSRGDGKFLTLFFLKRATVWTSFCREFLGAFGWKT